MRQHGFIDHMRMSSEQLVNEMIDVQAAEARVKQAMELVGGLEGANKANIALGELRLRLRTRFTSLKDEVSRRFEANDKKGK